MKRIYNKPQIVFESFQLTESIAAACGVKTATPTQGLCGVEYLPGIVIFTSDMTGICNTTYEDGKYDQLCYYIPTPEYLLFNSN